MNDGTTINAEQPLLTWESRIRLLTNPSAWSSMLLAFGIPSVLLGIFVAVVQKRLDYVLLVPLGSLAFFFGIYLVVALVIDAFGGFKATCFLTTTGVRSVSGKGAKAAATTAIVVGLLARKPGPIGAGLLARSEQDAFIAWKDITRIAVKAGRRYIVVKGEWGDKPIGLYCTRENFPQVMDILRQHAGDKMPAVDTGRRSSIVV